MKNFRHLFQDTGKKVAAMRYIGSFEVVKSVVHASKSLYDALPNNTLKVGVPALIAYAAKQ